LAPIRILELRGTYKGGGGPDKTILLSAARHSTERFFVLVAYLRDPRDQDFQIGELAKRYGVPYYVEVLDRSMFDIKCIAALNTLIRKFDIEIIHVHDLKTTLLGVILKALNINVKIMHTAHGWIVNNRQDRIKQQIQYLLLRCYPLHIAVSRATRELMVKSGIPQEEIEVLYNSIDTDYWNRQRGARVLRQEYNIDEARLIVGTVGRLSREKDLPTFISVARQILQKLPSTVFFVVGDGKADIVSELEKTIKASGLSEHIFLTGHRTDLIDVYSSFDLFLMTSLTEGLPNTVLESMALEVPVVVTNVGGLSELVIHNHSGMISPPGDSERIYKLCLELLENAKLRKKIGVKGRERICGFFDFNKRLFQIEKIYLQLVLFKK